MVAPPGSLYDRYMKIKLRTKERKTFSPKVGAWLTIVGGIVALSVIATIASLALFMLGLVDAN